MFDNVYILLVNEQGKNNEEDDGALTSYLNRLPDRLRFRLACAVNLRSDIGFKVRYIIIYTPHQACIVVTDNQYMLYIKSLWQI